MHPNVHGSTMYTIAKTLKKPKWIRIDEWVKKMGYTHRAILVIKG